MTDVELAYRKAEMVKAYKESYAMNPDCYPLYAHRLHDRLFSDLMQSGLSYENARTALSN